MIAVAVLWTDSRNDLSIEYRTRVSAKIFHPPNVGAPSRVGKRLSSPVKLTTPVLLLSASAIPEASDIDALPGAFLGFFATPTPVPQ